MCVVLTSVLLKMRQKSEFVVYSLYHLLDRINRWMLQKWMVSKFCWVNGNDICTVWNDSSTYKI